MHYASGAEDQFHHKYMFDADNRLTLAFTSRDGYIFDKDMKSFYYPHGPLARSETGDKQVLGCDYAYTIHGWIKGVNSNTLDETRDIGRDGDNTINTFFALQFINSGSFPFIRYKCILYDFHKYPKIYNDTIVKGNRTKFFKRVKSRLYLSKDTWGDV